MYFFHSLVHIFECNCHRFLKACQCDLRVNWTKSHLPHDGSWMTRMYFNVLFSFVCVTLLFYVEVRWVIRLSNFFCQSDKIEGVLFRHPYWLSNYGYKRTQAKRFANFSVLYFWCSHNRPHANKNLGGISSKVKVHCKRNAFISITYCIIRNFKRRFCSFLKLNL